VAEPPFIYRFTKDLRLDDHAGLASAAARGSVLPLLVIDRTIATRLRLSPRRAGFYCAAVRALAAELRERGSALVVRRGEPEKIVPAVAVEIGATGAAWSSAYNATGLHQDRRVQSALEESGFEAIVVHDAPAVAPEESAAARSAAGAGYRAFSPYFDVWCDLPIPSHEHPLLLRFSDCNVRSEPLPAPEEFGDGDKEVAAGAAAARRRLERFLREGVGQYAV
jgi:deoxyribodipyrimidine photo-lyase